MRACVDITLNTEKQGAACGDLFGVFFEDLNHAADGGLYAEMVRNRSFEFDPVDHPDYHALTAWEFRQGQGSGSVHVDGKHPLNSHNPHYAVLETSVPGVSLVNTGFNSGLFLEAGESYRFSVFARNAGTTPPVSLRVSLEDDTGRELEMTELVITAPSWEKYNAVLTVPATTRSGRLALTVLTEGLLALDMVSLFPVNTFKQRENGMRRDIAEMIAAMKPRFMRFPGGCLVHDGSLDPDARDSMYRWKNTLGPVESRPPRRNNWRYHQTLGLGYFEYFQFCEDIGAKPLPVLPGAYDPHHQRLVPLDELQPWIEDALDLIEFANGSTDTVWGSRRAAEGHPEPFGLEYIAIGNEEVGEAFFERYPYFHNAIREKYPDIRIINSSGPFAAGSEYERGWESARTHSSDLVDEHFYMSPEWFLAHTHRYDAFPAEGPKVFLGEYATWGNTWWNALTEAAFMTGLERNAHAVGLACYAPMLCNVDYINWKPDMIWFNNHQAYGSANYEVQKLFMHYHGDHLLELSMTGTDTRLLTCSGDIAGNISLVSDGIDAEISEIRYVDASTGQHCTFENVRLRKESPPHALTRVSGTGFDLSFTLVRTAGDKGIHLRFGETDEKNRLVWEIGGWQNQDSLVQSFTHGRGACLTQSIFSLETGRAYQMKLCVRGRKVQTWIDGVLINDTEDKPAVTETLYASATQADDGKTVILKTVNVREEEVVLNISLRNGRSITAVTRGMISGCQPGDENSFICPDHIRMTEDHPGVTEGKVSLVVPGQTVMAMKIQYL